MSDAFKDFINGLDFDLPEPVDEPPETALEVVEDKNKRKVFVQKVITEVWVYTDTDKKTFGVQTIQDLAVLGEMEFGTLMEMVGKEKFRRKGRK